MNFPPATHNTRRATQQRAVPWLIVAFVVFLLVGGAFAQVNPPGVVKGYNVTQYYPAPNFLQLKLQLTGAEGVQLPGPGLRAQVTKPNFRSFSPEGELQIAIETPACLYENNSNVTTVSSAEQLAMRTGDSRFSIKGKGFLWRQNEKILIISNDVHAVIHWTNNAPPLEITSRWFEFDAERRRGIFHDDVRGEDTNQFFTCELLAISGSTNKALLKPLLGGKDTNRTSFDLIEADGGLEITGKARPGYAKAQHGAFRQAEQRIDLTGDAVWNFSGYSGNADRMTVWMANTNIDASGKVRLSMPSSALGAAGGLLSTTNAPTKTAGTNIVTLFADRFTKRGEKLLAEGAVRINDGTNQLTCDKLEGKQATLKSPDEFASATGNVFVGREGGGIHSDRADYSKSTGQVLFTGNPHFLQEQVSGTAERVIVQLSNKVVQADGGVIVNLTFAGDSDNILNVLPNAKTNRVTKADRTNQTVQFTARTFSLHDQLALFKDNVAAHQLPIDGTEERMQCGELEVRFTADRHAESVQARQDVVCERGMEGVTNGPAEYTRMNCETLTANTDPKTGELVDIVAGGGVRVQQADGDARGEKAVYTQADQLLKLSGQAVIDRPEAVYKSSQGLSYNTTTKQVVGSYDSIRFKQEFLKRAGELEKLP